MSAGPPGLVAVWGDLRGAMRALLAMRPGEGRLLAYAMGSGFMRFLGRLAELWLGPGGGAAGREALVSRIGAEFAGALIFRTLALYLVAVLLWGVLRALGGRGGLYESRAALFWSAWVAAPVMLAATLAGLALEPVAGAQVAAGVELAGGLAFAAALAIATAEAHGLARVWPVLGAILALALGVVGTTALLAPGG